MTAQTTPAITPSAKLDTLTVQVKFNCGCGFITASQREAITHAYDEGHAITINGIIRVRKEKRSL